MFQAKVKRSRRVMAIAVGIVGLCLGIVFFIVKNGYFSQRNTSESLPVPGAIKSGKVPTIAGDMAAAVPVTLASVVQQDVPVVLTLNANVFPMSSVPVHAQVSNLLRQVHIREGQMVKTNELLFTLDGRADEAQVDKARAQVVKDQAVLTDLKRQYERALNLLTQKFVTPSFADNLLTQVQAQESGIEADKAILKAAQLNASYNILRAPSSGRIGSVQVYPGSLITPAQPLVTITQMDPIALVFSVPEKYLSVLLIALKKRAAVEACVNGRPSMRGELYFVDSSVESTTGTVLAKARFQNTHQDLWPGQYLTVKLVLETLKNAAVIPAESVLQSSEGPFVYVGSLDNKAQKRPIRILYAWRNDVAVSGVRLGEQVVMNGKQNLRLGSLYRQVSVSASPVSSAH
jgi:multidrug efflux system membrane fusion protein